MTCVLTDREGRGYEWTCECDKSSYKEFASQRDITKLILAACIEKKDGAIRDILEFAESRGVHYNLNRLFCVEGGPSLFGEESHYSDGFITPIFAVVMGIVSMREDTEADPRTLRCVELLLEHSANPYQVCKITENCFPVEISKFDLDVRGLLRLCKMFQIGSTRTADEVEILLDTFEMKLGLQDL